MNKDNNLNIGEELVNTLQVKTTIDPNEDRKFVQIGSTNYDKFVVVNPKLSTSQSWYNISQSIGNNTFTITNFLDRTDDPFPDIIRGALRYTGNTLNKLDNNPIITYDEAMRSIDPTLYQFSNQWEIGTINTTNPNAGQNAPANPLFPRIRTKGFIPIDKGYDIASFFNISSPNNGVIIFYYNSAFGFIGVSSAGLSTNNTFQAPLNTLQSKYIRIIAGYIDSSPITPADIEDFGLLLVSGYAYNSPSPSLVQSNEYRAVCSLITNPFNTFSPIGSDPNYLAYIWALLGDNTTIPPGSNVIANNASYYQNGVAANINGPVILTNTSSIIDLTIDQLQTISIILQLSKYIGTTITPMFLEDVSLISNIPHLLKWNYALSPTPGGYAEIRKVVTIPDGYYSGIDSTPTQAGMQTILDLITNVWAISNFTIRLDVVPSYKIVIECPVPVTLFFSSTAGTINNNLVTTLDTSGPILGYPNNINYVNLAGTPVGGGNLVSNSSPFDFDLFTGGRFYTCNINLSLFHTTGYIGESSSLISFSAQGQYGKSILENDISYQKILPPNLGSIQNFTLTVTDAFDKPIILNDRIFVRFEIQCYRKNKGRIHNF